MASAVVMPYDNHRDVAELRVISSSADINGSLFTDAIVQKNCSVHVWGSVSGSLTISRVPTSSSTVQYMEKSSIGEAVSSSTTKG